MRLAVKVLVVLACAFDGAAHAQSLNDQRPADVCAVLAAAGQTTLSDNMPYEQLTGFDRFDLNPGMVACGDRSYSTRFDGPLPAYLDVGFSSDGRQATVTIATVAALTQGYRCVFARPNSSNNWEGLQRSSDNTSTDVCASA